MLRKMYKPIYSIFSIIIFLWLIIELVGHSSVEISFIFLIVLIFISFLFTNRIISSVNTKRYKFYKDEVKSDKVESIQKRDSKTLLYESLSLIFIVLIGLRIFIF